MSLLMAPKISIQGEPSQSLEIFDKLNLLAKYPDKFLARHGYSRIVFQWKLRHSLINGVFDYGWVIARECLIYGINRRHVARGLPIFWLKICHPQRWDGGKREHNGAQKIQIQIQIQIHPQRWDGGKMVSTAELKLIVQAVADNMKNHTKYRFTLECWISELSTGKITNQSNFFRDGVKMVQGRDEK